MVEGLTTNRVEVCVLSPEIFLEESKESLHTLSGKGSSKLSSLDVKSLKLLRFLQSSYVDSLKPFLLKNGLETIRGIILDGFSLSWTLGSGSSPTDSQMKLLKKAAEEEFGYAKKFARFSKDSKSVNSSRLKLYANTLEGVATMGFLSVLDPSAQIRWVVKSGETCVDCLRLAKGGPYSLKGRGGLPRLITVPRMGQTRCLSNCRCSLEIDYPEQ